MKRKLRIFSNIAIIALSVCMFAFGVYAASTVSVTTSGTVSFSATDVYANVKLEVDNGSGTYTKVKEIDFDSSTTTPNVVWDTDDLDFVFNEDLDDIKFLFTITNKAQDRNLDFTFTDNSGTATNIRKLSFVSANMYDETNSKYNVNPAVAGVNNVETVEIEFRVKDANKSANLEYNFAFQLTDQTAVAGIASADGFEKVGNTYVMTTELASGKQLTDYTVTGTTSYKEYRASLSGNSVITPIHVYGTGLTAISANVTDLKLSGHFYANGTGFAKLGGQDDSYSVSGYTETSYTVPVAVYQANLGKALIVNSFLLGIYADSSDYYNGLTSFTMSDNVTTIDGVAQYNQKLTSVRLSDYITEIPYATFRNCYSLQTLNLPKNLVSIGNQAFMDCNALATTEVPDTLKSIGEHAFSCCSELAFSGLPEGLESIGYGAIEDANKCTFTTIPGSLKNIPDSALRHCDLIENITLEEGIETIGEAAFYSWDNLKTISLPNSLKSLGAECFGCCNNDSAVEITYAGTVSQWNVLNANNIASFPSGSVVTCSDETVTIA